MRRAGAAASALAAGAIVAMLVLIIQVISLMLTIPQPDLHVADRDCAGAEEGPQKRPRMAAVI